MTEKPNILLIVTDTFRCDALHCMGNEKAVSPNIDKLAAGGVIFDEAHTSSPVCMPARCSLITGLHTPVHGCLENGMARKERQITLPDILRKEGYTNLMFGKTHFGPVPDSFDLLFDPSPKDFKVPAGENFPDEKKMIDTHIVDRTISEIEKLKTSEKPFFAFCSLHAPHPPVNPPEDWDNLYSAEDIPPLNCSENEFLSQPEHLKLLAGISIEGNRVSEGENPGDYRYWREAIGRIYDPAYRQAIIERRRLYYCYASWVDSLVGRLTDHVAESGLDRNTLIIFTSDHGQQLFDHGFNDKHNFYDESWRIPFIMRMPGTLPQGVSADFATWNDIAPTILAAAGASCPTMQGFDLFTPLTKGLDSPRKCAVGSIYKSCAIAGKRWKLEYFIEEAGGRLFDRVNDPKEQNDLSARPECRELYNELLTALLTWRCDLQDLRLDQAGTMKETEANEQGYRIVAKRAAMHMHAMKGSDCETRLQERINAIEEKYKDEFHNLQS